MTHPLQLPQGVSDLASLTAPAAVPLSADRVPACMINGDKLKEMTSKECSDCEKSRQYVKADC